jgi:phage baseplate assembly protein W
VVDYSVFKGINIMATYLGFSTQNACNPKTTNMSSGSAGGPGGIRQGISWGNKFSLTDAELVVQNLVNALNIRLGTKVGQPGYGTRLWDFIFEPNSASTQSEIENEIKRLASQDPRLQLAEVVAYSFENGILIEMQCAILPFNQPIAAKISLSRATQQATLV